jgi:hypothetical protein
MMPRTIGRTFTLGLVLICAIAPGDTKGDDDKAKGKTETPPATKPTPAPDAKKPAAKPKKPATV